MPAFLKFAATRRIYGRETRRRCYAFLMLWVLVLSTLLLNSCDLSTIQSDQNGQYSTFTGSTAPITYNTDAHTVLIRTFHGGGLQGSLQLGPDVSIYGDGTYLLGLEKQGKLTTDDLHLLLNTLVDNYGLLDFKRQQFADIRDENATFLELSLNNKQVELIYGTFASQQASPEDRDEYQRMGKALTTIIEALKGPLHAYNSTANALLVHQTFGIDYHKALLPWRLFTLPLAEVATYECGDLIPDETSPNAEAGCLKYLIPRNALLLTTQQLQTLKEQLSSALQSIFVEGGRYYIVILRPLLPDEMVTKTLAMFGSTQNTFKAVPLHEGTIPPSISTPITQQSNVTLPFVCGILSETRPPHDIYI